MFTFMPHNIQFWHFLVKIPNWSKSEVENGKEIKGPWGIYLSQRWTVE